MIDIRRATLDDLETLAALRMEFMAETGSLRDGTVTPTLLEATRQYLAGHLPEEQYVAWIAEVQGEVVAISGLVFLERPPTPNNLPGLEGYILNLYTLPEWRGRGFGTAMLAQAIDCVKARGARRAWLRATPVGRHLYERAGFVRINDSEDPRGIEQMELVW